MSGSEHMRRMPKIHIVVLIGLIAVGAAVRAYGDDHRPLVTHNAMLQTTATQYSQSVLPEGPGQIHNIGQTVSDLDECDAAENLDFA